MLFFERLNVLTVLSFRQKNVLNIFLKNVCESASINQPKQFEFIEQFKERRCYLANTVSSSHKNIPLFLKLKLGLPMECSNQAGGFLLLVGPPKK